VAVSINQAGLSAGQYYGSVTVNAPNASNNPQSVLVLLNVAAGDSSANIAFSTGNVSFVVPPGTTTNQKQQISLFNPSSSTLGYSSTVSTSNGGSWLSLSPDSGQLLPGSTSIQIVVNPALLSAGVQTGTLTLGFDNGTAGTVQVTALATDASLVPNVSRSAGSPVPLISSSQACVKGSPGYLVPVIRQPAALTALKVALPQKLEVQVNDDCGHPLSSANGGTVHMMFSNSSTSINLQDTGGGVWEGTWTPLNSGAQVILGAVAAEFSPALHSISSQVAVSVQAAPPDAPAQISGVVNAASTAQAIPQLVVPGSYVAIYGAGLASGGSPVATTVPLSTTLNGTQLLLGNQPLPLLYAGDGQVNALIPQNLSTETTYQLTVRRGSTLSVPIPITVARYQPGIYTLNFSGEGQGIAEIVGTTLVAGPDGNGYQPVRRGSDYLAVFATGLGAVIGTNGEAPPADGAAAPLTTVYRSVGTVSATIGGVDVPVFFSGLTPSLVGLYQVNIQVTDSVPTGDAVPVVITVTDPVTGKSTKSNTVTIAVQ
jgi:uncharacterized protein (TIGR03437 family)